MDERGGRSRNNRWEEGQRKTLNMWNTIPSEQTCTSHKDHHRKLSELQTCERILTKSAFVEKKRFPPRFLSSGSL